MLSNVCRSCLTAAETFSFFIYENVSPELYCFCTSIEVKLDNLPKALCSYCYELLQKFTEFKKTCMQSEETLLGSAFHLKLEQDTEFKKENETYHKDSVTEDLVKQEGLNVKFQDASAVHLYNDNHKEQRTCLREKKIKTKGSPLKETKIKESIQCKSCNKTFSSWSGLHRHNKIGHSPVTFKDLTCKVCSKVCKTPLTLKIHNRTHEKRKVQICDECGKAFISDITLKNHLETHIKNRKQSYICEHCGKKYLSKKTRAKHISRRHTDRRFICHYCNYPFIDKANLIKHIMSHEGKQKLYKCDLCSRALSSQASLVVHMRMHTGERPFSCSYCPKRFSSKGIMMDHHRMHTGEKPFKCAVCEQSFTQRGSMKRHMKVHHQLHS